MGTVLPSLFVPEKSCPFGLSGLLQDFGSITNLVVFVFVL